MTGPSLEVTADAVTKPSLEVVDDEAGFAALRPEWNALASASADANVFLTWEWLHTWWRHRGAGRDGGRLHVVLVREAGELVAAAPLYRARLGVAPGRAEILRQVSFDAGDYGGVLLRRMGPNAGRANGSDPAVERAVGLLVEHVTEQLGYGVHTVVLSRLASDSMLLAELRHHLADPACGLAAVEADLGDACPYADVRQGYDLARHLKKHKVRQRMRRLSDAYEVAFHHHTGPTLEAGLEALVELHRRRWDDRSDDFQGLLADPAHEAFLLDAVRALDRQGWVRLLSLTADGRPVAVELDFDFGGRVSMFKGAFDPDFAPYSPGQLTHYQVFEEGLARGVAEFDFMRGDHPYKRRWTNRERRLVTVSLTRSGWPGRLARHRTRAASALHARRG